MVLIPTQKTDAGEIVDYGAEVHIRDFRMTAAFVRLLEDGRWLAVANDSGGMGIQRAWSVCPVDAAREAKWFGYHGQSHHREMEALETYLRENPRAGCHH